jgi:hypothetical protein
MEIADEMKVALRTAYYAWRMGADIAELAKSLEIHVGTLARMFSLRQYRDFLKS